MNISKWLPKQNNDMNKIFTETRNIERELRILGKMFATNINYKNPDYYVSMEALVTVWLPFPSPSNKSCAGISGSFGSRQHGAGGKLAYAI